MSKKLNIKKNRKMNRGTLHIRLNQLWDALSRATTSVENVKELMDGYFDTSLQVNEGTASIAIHGPDCEILAWQGFKGQIKRLVNSDDDWLIENAPVWLKDLEWALKYMQDELAKANKRKIR